MDYISILKTDIEKGYSKSDLEKLIGLPKNNLTEILKGNRKLSKKSMLKIEAWEQSEKPTLLEKYFQESREEIKKSVNHLMETGIAITKTNLTGKTKAIHPMSEEGFMVQDMLKGTPKTLDQLKTICPKELTGLERSQWISKERVKYGI